MFTRAIFEATFTVMLLNANTKEALHAVAEQLAGKNCKHKNVAWAKKICSDKSIRYWKFCEACGRKQSGLVARKKLPMSLYGFSEELDNSKLWLAYFEKRSKIDSAWREKYEAYIVSEAWRAKSNECKQSAGYKCQNCGGRAEDTHHKTYERLFNELPDDLEALCHYCHSVIRHGRNE
jgi:hypothetical protein